MIKYIFILLILFQSTLLAQRFDPKAIYDKCKDGVVVITLTDGQGSGFIISKDGWIATNKHVIAGVDVLRGLVSLYNGKQYRIQDYDMLDFLQVDLALIKIEPEEELTVLPLLPDGVAKVGENIVVIGHPRGLKWTQTAGIVGGYIRTFITIDASSTFGNSGGPILNDKGQVVGILQGGKTNSQNTNFGENVEWLRKALELLKIPYTTKPIVESGMSVNEVIDENIKEKIRVADELVKAKQQEVSTYEERLREKQRKAEEANKLIAQAEEQKKIYNEREKILSEKEDDIKRSKNSAIAEIQQRTSQLDMWEGNLRQKERTLKDEEFRLEEEARALRRRIDLARLHLEPERFSIEGSLASYAFRQINASQAMAGLRLSLSVLHRMDIKRESAQSVAEPVNRIGIQYGWQKIYDIETSAFSEGFINDVGIIFDYQELLRVGAGFGLRSANTLFQQEHFWFFQGGLFATRYPVPVGVIFTMITDKRVSGNNYYGIGLQVGLGINLIRF